MHASVTLLYGGLCGLLLVYLGSTVSRLRGVHQVKAGDTPPESLFRHIRAHGNAAEWIPIGVVLLLLLEIGGLGSLPLHVLGGAFLLGRTIHALAFPRKNPASVAGMTLTYTSLAAMAGWAIFLHFGK